MNYFKAYYLKHVFSLFEIQLMETFEIHNIKRGVIICGFMVYTVKDLCGFIMDLLWIYEDLCRFMRLYGGFMKIYFPQNDLWCTQFWADVYLST